MLQEYKESFIPLYGIQSYPQKDKNLQETSPLSDVQDVFERLRQGSYVMTAHVMTDHVKNVCYVKQGTKRVTKVTTYGFTPAPIITKNSYLE